MACLTFMPVAPRHPTALGRPSGGTRTVRQMNKDAASSPTTAQDKNIKHRSQASLERSLSLFCIRLFFTSSTVLGGFGQSHLFSDSPLTVVGKNIRSKSRAPEPLAVRPQTGYSTSLSPAFLTCTTKARVVPYEC